MDLTWLKSQIAAFQSERPRYEAYSVFLDSVLRKAAVQLAPTATVQVRVKSMPSFAEKCLRKKQKYDQPAYQLTDLCGARIIAYSQEEVEALCDFVRKQFEVDEKNSEDKLKILQANQFGYRSVHFVVQTRSGGTPGLEADPGLLASINAPGPQGKPFLRKAEIQIRTYMQHVWADVFHDRLYKTAMKIPSAYQRQANALAAQLETLDGLLDGLMARMDAYHGDLGAYMGAAEIQNEIEIQSALLSGFAEEKDQPAMALRLAKLHKIQGTREGWKAVIATTEPFRNGNTPTHRQLGLEWGNALCRFHPPGSPEFQKGLDCLLALAKLDAPIDPKAEKSESVLRARALDDLGYAAARTRQDDFRLRAKKYYSVAHSLIPGNPYYFCRYLIAAVKESRGHKALEPVQPWIFEAIRICEDHVAVGVELPEACFSLFWLHWFSNPPRLDRKPEALGYLLRALGNSSTERLREECISVLDLADQLRHEDHLWVPELEEAAMILLIAGIAKEGEKLTSGSGPEREFFHRLSTEVPEKFLGDPKPTDKYLIVAGNASIGMEQKDIGEWGDILAPALEGLEGVVFGPGTNAGMGAALGDAWRKLKIREAVKNQRDRKAAAEHAEGLRLLALLPTLLPSDANKDEAYESHSLPARRSQAAFSFREPLFTWFTLLQYGVQPSRVRLLGVGGGNIAAFEFRLALMLGARVGVVAACGRAAKDILDESPWWPRQTPDGLAALVNLPKDAMSVMAFLHAGDVKEDKRFEAAARMAHEEYVRSQSQYEVRPELRPWETLPADFRISNFHQAAFAATILRRGRFGLRPGKDFTPLNFSDPRILSPETLEMMAEMEHGRWNVERLLQGWKLGKTSDKPNRVNANLVPWADLAEEVRDWDRNAIRGLPEKMKKAGLEIYPLERS